MHTPNEAKGNTVHKRGPAMKNSYKSHFWAHSIIGPKSGIKPHTLSSLSVGKLGPHVSKTQNTSESSCYLIELTLKKKKAAWSSEVI